MEGFSRAAFKAYDIRGRVPDELNEAMAYRVGRVFAEVLSAKKVVVGRDIRLTSEPLADALMRGLIEAGCNVVNIGLCGTEQVYFATTFYHADGGIMITASHNPMDYNGMKLVRSQSRPISGDTGLRQIEEMVVSNSFEVSVKPTKQGVIQQQDCMADYVKHLLSYIQLETLCPLRIVVNSGNGCAGLVIDHIEKYLPFEFIKINHVPDGTFPQGIPNPLLKENQSATAEAVKFYKADLGIAWDGDFDRCFFFDEQGHFIEGYYIVGFLAQAFLRKNSGAKIIYDPRLTWNTIEIVSDGCGHAVQSKTGHAFIKERMRQEDAVYGGEMSAHHYFRDFFYCDSGMIPWLLIVESLSLLQTSLSSLVVERIAKYPVSGEINRKVTDVQSILMKIEQKYLPNANAVDRTDGLSLAFDTWRFNLRLSNTEPLLRLNVESRGDRRLMEEKTAELLQLIESR